MESALSNKNIDILGHPFECPSKDLGERPKEKILKASSKNANLLTKFLKLILIVYRNHKWLLKTCVKHNVKISLGSNAHNTKDVGMIYKIIK